MKKLSLVLVLSLLFSMVTYGEDLWRRGLGSAIWPLSGVDEVGIGTGDPFDKLDVRGTVRMTGFRLTTGAHSGYVLTSNSSGWGTWQPAPGGGTSFWDDNGDDIYCKNNGNVGIGTASPQYDSKLHVIGNIRIPYDNRMIFGGAAIEGYQGGGGYGGLKFYGEGGGGVASNLAITVDPSGNVGIGTDQVLSKLTVNGTITAEEIEVQVEILPDFVFEDGYELMPLDKLERHIKKEKSLPGIPTSDEAIEEGVKLGEMQAKLLEKVEELTLYVIGQDKELTELKKEVGDLRKENRELQQKISSLSN